MLLYKSTLFWNSFGVLQDIFSLCLVQNFHTPIFFEVNQVTPEHECERLKEVPLPVELKLRSNIIYNVYRLFSEFYQKGVK